MLAELQRTYEKTANRINGWKNINKNKLANLCIENEHDPLLYQAYLSALICKYWKCIGIQYSSSYKSVTIEDCYEWVINAILYSLKHRKWLDPNSNLYNDPNGPDKAINVCIATERRIFYQAANTDVRRINFTLASSDSLFEEYGDCVFPVNFDENLKQVEDPTRHIVNQAFNDKNYFLAFMVDRITSYNVFDKVVENNKTYSVFNEKRLARYMRNMDNCYIKEFSDKFGFNINEVQAAATSCMSLSRIKTKSSITRNMKILSKSKWLKN